MASNIKGITVEIGGDTTGLSKALKGMNTEINTTQKELKEVEKLLKLDPTNTTLLAQKQQLLATQIEQTKNKVSSLKDAQSQANKAIENGADISSKQYRQLEREIVSSEQSLKNLGNEAIDSGKKMESAAKGGYTQLDEILANLKTKAIEGVIKGLKNLADSAVDFAKSVVSGYAEYEQLAGGVETLFKDSAGEVENYANNAYKTAGLSANEYMETVTSFSASLLQSLNGDTAETAKVADMAITDMADNANKMGTSMSSIQSAYQGFAKQNYTMLDNLKLGYGGTKSEMERLLKDAEKLSGQKYDISNLNDVYEAIHVVQTELGITGTTAKEATKTISGSISAMKSAWTNLVAGMSNENADLEGLVNNVVDSVITVLDNIVPRIEVFVQQIPNIMTNLISKISEFLPKLLETGSKILESLIDGVKKNLPQVINIVSQIIQTLSSTIITMLPEILEMGIVILTQLIEGIAQQLPALVPAIVECILLIVNTILDNLDTVIAVGLDVILALIQGIINSLPKIIEQLPVIVQSIVNTVIDNLPLLLEASLQIILMLAKGLIENLPELLKAIPEIIMSLVDGFNNLMGKIRDIGRNLIEGIWNGMKNAKQWLIDKIRQLCNDALDAIKAFFGIASPSKVMRDEVGKFLAEGIGVGFSRSIPGVIEDMKNKLGSVASELSGDLLLGDIPQLQGGEVINQNRYVTKNYTNTMNTFRDAQPLVLSIDGKTFARAIIPSMDAEYIRMGVAQA